MASQHTFPFPPPGWPTNSNPNPNSHPPAPPVNNPYMNVQTHPTHHYYIPPSFAPPPSQQQQQQQRQQQQYQQYQQQYQQQPPYSFIPTPGRHPSYQPPPPNQPYFPPSAAGSIQHSPVPHSAYPAPVGNYRQSYASAPAPTPTRSSYSQYPPTQLYTNQPRQSHYQPNGTVPPPSASARANIPSVYHHPQTHAPGPLGFFLAPPGQPTTDPSLTTPPTSQANYTTYPSRLRTGATGLIQPERVTGGPREREAFYADLERDLNPGRTGSGASTPRYDSPLPYGGGGRKSAAAASGRRGRVVNYAEKASDDEDDEDEEDSELSDVDEPASDPEDDSYGGHSGRRPGRPRLNRDRDSSLMVGGQSARAAKAIRRREEMDKGWTWLGDRVPGDRVRSQKMDRTAHQYVSEELLEDAADRPDLIVPITVDLEVSSGHPNSQGIRIKDRFLWNINEPFIDPRSFAEIFCNDIGIPVHAHAETIESLIKAQLEEAQNTVEIDVQDEDATEDDVVWSDEEVEDVVEVQGQEEQAEGMQLDTPLSAAQEPGAPAGQEGKEHADADAGAGAKANGDVEVEAEDAEVEEKEKVWEEADCRIIVNLDVQIYTHILRDRIEWDLSSSLPPSVFAKQYCAELGLTGEAIPLITFAIHEELLKHKKDALELELFAQSHPGEQAKFDKTNIYPKTNLAARRTGAGRGLKGVWRDWVEREDFAPVLVELSFEEIAAREQERTREARRMIRALGGNKRRR